MENSATNSTNGVKSIKLIIKLLKKEKIFIIVIALIIFLISLAYSIFSSQTTYKTDFKINVNTVSPVNTSFGPYRMPFSSIDEYISILDANLTTELASEYSKSDISSGEISSSISTQLSKNFNTFTVNIKSEDPDKSLDIAESLLAAYTKRVELTLRVIAVNHFINETESLKLLTENALFILNNEYNQGIKDLSEATKYLSETSEEKILNPFYEQLSFEIANLKIRINTRESELKSITNILENLTTEKNELTIHAGTKEFVSTIPGAFSAFKSIINIVEEPSKSELADSGSIFFDLSLGLVFGIMLGIILAFIKDFWKTNIV